MRPEMIVYKDFEFDFAHLLPNYNGPCKNLHGHRGKMRVYVKGPVDPETGMVMDFVWSRHFRHCSGYDQTSPGRESLAGIR